MDLSGVEFKSLPSGLHAVKNDLIYFIHGANAGISAFVQAEADAAQRHASFVAVGALVPLSHGQLGRSWIHAEKLRELAKEVVKDTTDTRALELFWKQNRADEVGMRGAPPGSQPSSPISPSRKRKRMPSEATIAGFKTEGSWPLDHPALAMLSLLDTFGPLLFPLQRAALLRKRLLFLGGTPVQKNCNNVYNTSILSTIPQQLREILPVASEPLFQCRPLFSVGIQEMDVLADKSSQNPGWLTCTTDDILGEKKQLYDFKVEMSSISRSKSLWPTLKTADGKIIKASQRDHRRWQQLTKELKRLRKHSVERYSDDADDDEETSLLRANTAEDEPAEGPAPVRDESEVVEPSSWSALAYRGFMWWASAGEASAWENDETQADEELLFDLPDVAEILSLSSSSDNDDSSSSAVRESYFARAAATIIVAYFRRVTEGILRTMANVIEEADDNTEEGLSEDAITISFDDIRAMGLDSWSEVDKAFVIDMVRVWHGREAVVVDSGVQICGLRIC